MNLPIFSRPYRMLAYKICHRLRISAALSKHFKSVKPLLHQAELYITLEEYISTAVFTIAITAPFIFYIFRMAFILLYDMVPAIATIMGVILAVSYASIVAIGFFIFPGYRVNNIKRNMERNIPYATTHMATVAGTGVPIYLVFKILGDFPEYGQLSRECRRISRNIEVFGYDIITAMSESASKTPSPSFKDLMWGMVSVIRTGGDLRQFLVDKSRLYMENQRNLEEEYIDSLELMAEMYTTIFVAGPVLFVVMATIMGSMGSLPIGLDLLFILVIYIAMPLLAVGFILMIEGSKPIGAM